MTISGQATFTFANDDDEDVQTTHTFYVYAVNGSLARLDDCVYAQNTYNGSEMSGKWTIELQINFLIISN